MASLSELTKAAMSSAWVRRRSPMGFVAWLPTRSQMTFGGAPYRKASCPKSESLETIT